MYYMHYFKNIKWFLLLLMKCVFVCLCVTEWETLLWQLRCAPLASKCTWAVKPKPWRWRRGPDKPWSTSGKVAQDLLYSFLLSETAPDWSEWPWCMLSLKYQGKCLLSVRKTACWNQDSHKISLNLKSQRLHFLHAY